jgi:hypothetical protein
MTVHIITINNTCMLPIAIMSTTGYHGYLISVVSLESIGHVVFTECIKFGVASNGITFIQNFVKIHFIVETHTRGHPDSFFAQCAKNA